MNVIHSIIDLSEHDHSFQVLPHHSTSFRGIALILCSVIFLAYSLHL